MPHRHHQDTFYAFGAGRICSQESLELYKKHNPALYQFHLKYRASMSEAQKARIHKATGKLLAQLEGQLEGKDFLMGSQYTVAEVAWVTNVIFLQRMGYDISGYINVCVWKKGAYIRKYLPMRTLSTTDFLMVRRWTARGFYPIFRGALWSSFSLESDL